MLWTASTEVMRDLWYLRFGNERVSYRQLFNDRAMGCPNDWPYVARFLQVARILQRTETPFASDIFYQLINKE